MSVGKAAGPQWWSRPDPVTPPAPPGAPAGPAGPPPSQMPPERAEQAPQAPPTPAVPRHAPDPYDTPPYGAPGPWAPAPQVQPVPQVQPDQPVRQVPLVPSAQPLSVGHWQTALPIPVRPPVPPRGRRGRLGAGLAALVLLAGVLGGAVGAYLRAGDGGHPQSGAVATPQATPAKRAPDSVAAIAARTLPGVVYIHVRSAGSESTGTGFVLDRQGHILTNNHVVEPAAGDAGGTVSVTFNNRQVVRNARIVGRDSGYDLAVIQVSGATSLHPLALGDSDSVRVGDPVVAFGAPYDLEGTVTSGIISATHRPIAAGGDTDAGGSSDVSYVDALQTDAPINPGNSGGPLVDAGGLVVGINSAIRSAGSSLGGGQGGSIGLGFSIPVNQARPVADELIRTGRATHPVIGVSVDMHYTGDGARVDDEVTPDGPGDRAGIRSGDVITAVDGERIHSGQELIVRIRSHRPGDRLALTVSRDGRARTVRLTLGSATGS